MIIITMMIEIMINHNHNYQFIELIMDYNYKLDHLITQYNNHDKIHQFIISPWPTKGTKVRPAGTPVFYYGAWVMVLKRVLPRDLPVSSSPSAKRLGISFRNDWKEFYSYTHREEQEAKV